MTVLNFLFLFLLCSGGCVLSHRDPEINCGSHLMTVFPGDSLCLPCVVDGDPFPKASWKHQKSGIIVNFTNTNFVLHNNGSLCISQVQQKYFGGWIIAAYAEGTRKTSGVMVSLKKTTLPPQTTVKFKMPSQGLLKPVTHAMITTLSIKTNVKSMLQTPSQNNLQGPSPDKNQHQQNLNQNQNGFQHVTGSMGSSTIASDNLNFANEDEKSNNNSAAIGGAVAGVTVIGVSSTIAFLFRKKLMSFLFNRKVTPGPPSARVV